MTEATPRPWEEGDRPDTIVSGYPTTVIAEGVSPEDRPLIVRAVNSDAHVAPLMEALEEIEALAKVRTNGWNFGEIARAALAAAQEEAKG